MAKDLPLASEWAVLGMYRTILFAAMSTFTMMEPGPKLEATLAISSTVVYDKEQPDWSIPSFTLFPLGWDRSVISQPLARLMPLRNNSEPAYMNSEGARLRETHDYRDLFPLLNNPRVNLPCEIREMLREGFAAKIHFRKFVKFAKSWRNFVKYFVFVS